MAVVRLQDQALQMAGQHIQSAPSSNSSEGEQMRQNCLCLVSSVQICTEQPPVIHRLGGKMSHWLLGMPPLRNEEAGASHQKRGMCGPGLLTVLCALLGQRSRMDSIHQIGPERKHRAAPPGCSAAAAAQPPPYRVGTSSRGAMGAAAWARVGRGSEARPRPRNRPPDGWAGSDDRTAGAEARAFTPRRSPTNSRLRGAGRT